MNDRQQNFYKLLLINIRVKCLKQGIKNRNSVLNRVGKSAKFVLNRVRVRGAAPHLPTQEVESRRGESRRVQSSCNGIEDEKVFIVGSS